MNSNIKKTIYFLKRNGVRRTYYAVMERLAERKNAPYEFEPVSVSELNRQKEELKGLSLPFISIVVPAYHTPRDYMLKLIDSVLAQSYDNWELIIADASDDQSVNDSCKLYQDLRIKYIKLDKNEGISDNTNHAIQYAEGEYIALLDHDDLITPDALYEMTSFFRASESDISMVYSDEDKCNEDESIFFDVHRKLDLNKDLLLTNNYICHFSMIKADLLKKLLLRREFDGAQDFDLFLRVMKYSEEHNLKIKHVPKVLYHWRSHELSTAANPQSKLYAYEAGQRAIQDYLLSCGTIASVIETPHVGFYRVDYGRNPFEKRSDLAAIVKKEFRNGKIVFTVYDENKSPCWQGLSKGFSGYMHRASLQQDVAAGLLWAMIMPEEWAEVAVCELKEQLLRAEERKPAVKQEKWYLEFINVIKEIELRINKKNNIINFSAAFCKFINRFLYNEEAMGILTESSFQFAERIKEAGKFILYDPYLK